MLFLFLFEQTVLRFIYGVLILCQYCMYNMSNMLIWIIMLSFKIKIKIRLLDQFSENKYMLKFNNGSTTKRCGMSLKLIIRAPKRCATDVALFSLFLLRSGIFIVNFEHISYLFPVFLLLTLNK